MQDEPLEHVPRAESSQKGSGLFFADDDESVGNPPCYVDRLFAFPPLQGLERVKPAPEARRPPGRP